MGEHFVQSAGNSINAGSFGVMIKKVLSVAAVLEIRLPESKETGTTKRRRIAANKPDQMLYFLLLYSFNCVFTTVI